jgi:hypothetical protein
MDLNRRKANLMADALGFLDKEMKLEPMVLPDLA